MLADKNFRRLLFAGLVALIIEFSVIYVVCLFLAGRPYESPLTYALIGLAGLYAFRVADGVINMIVATGSGSGLLEAIAASNETSPAAKRFALASIGEWSATRLRG